MHMDNNADAKGILSASPPADWRRQLGCPCITWLSTVQQDLKQNHLTLPEAADLAQNRPLWRIMLMYGATQSWVACQKRRRRRLPSEIPVKIAVRTDLCSLNVAVLVFIWERSRSRRVRERSRASHSHTIQVAQLSLIGCAQHHTSPFGRMCTQYELCQVPHTLTENTTEAAAGIQPIAVRPHASLLKIAHWCYLPVRSSYGCMLTFQQHSQGLVRVRFHCGLGMTTRVPVLPTSEMYAIIWSLVLMHYEHVIDRQTCNVTLQHSRGSQQNEIRTLWWPHPLNNKL